MAEEIKGTGTEQAGTEPTIAELQAQLAQLNAEKEQLRSSLTKSNSEAANYKKALREKQSAEEVEAAAKAEADKLQREELEALRKELNHNKAMAAYKEIQDEQVVQKLIDAISNADHASVAQIIANECNSAVARAEASWLDSRPRINAGVGDSGAMAKKDIMAIKDSAERQRLIAENMNLFI